MDRIEIAIIGGDYKFYKDVPLGQGAPCVDDILRSGYRYKQGNALVIFPSGSIFRMKVYPKS
jgi:hypothetical protein